MDAIENSICGWELNNPDPGVFDTKIVEVFGHCKACQYVDECPAPSESIRRLVPKEGRVVELGHEHPEAKERISYFAWINGEDVRFIQLREPDHYWAKASYVDREQVPYWASYRLEPGQWENRNG